MVNLGVTIPGYPLPVGLDSISSYDWSYTVTPEPPGTYTDYFKFSSFYLQAENLHEILNSGITTLYGEYDFTITATLIAEPSVMASYTLSLTLTDPCLNAKLNITSADMDEAF